MAKPKRRSLESQAAVPMQPARETSTGRRDAWRARQELDEDAAEERLRLCRPRCIATSGGARASPTFTIPLQVASILADLQFDQTCVIVGLLARRARRHAGDIAGLEKRFGDEIAQLVDGVTKIGRHEYVRRDDAQAETFRKLVLASAKDIRVILVKLADGITTCSLSSTCHPSRGAASPGRRWRSTLRSRSAWAWPSCRATSRISPSSISIRISSRRCRRRCRRSSRSARGHRPHLQHLARALEEAGLEAEISSRVKRYYSIYRKLRRQGIDISQLYDYLAFRIVTRDVRTATRRWVSSISAGGRCRVASRTTSRCRSRTSTSRCIRR